MEIQAIDELWFELGQENLSTHRSCQLRNELKQLGSVTPRELWEFVSGREVEEDVRAVIGREMYREQSFIAQVLEDIDCRSGHMVWEPEKVRAIQPGCAKADERTALQKLIAMTLSMK